MISEDYVVTTYYRSSPEKRPITHAYGPYLKADAVKLRREILDDPRPLKPGAVLHVAVCRMMA